VAIFNIFGKKDVSSDITKNIPYVIATEFTPYKLYSNKKSSVTMSIKLKNNTNEALLTSMVIELPQKLGFDQVGVAKQKEIRVGKLNPREEKILNIDIFSNIDADAGDYTINLTAIAHYLDYGHVINSVRKRTLIGVV
jgi:uncharacterized membrane protein